MQKRIDVPAVQVDQSTFTNRLAQAGATPYEIEMIDKMMDGLENPVLSHEYGAYIIHSMETGQPRIVYGNVMNEGLIDNLPRESCVEVPCLVDQNGLKPIWVGRVPLHLASLIQTNINVQALTVEAALTQKRERIYHAAMLDPHTAAELDLEQIWALVDAMIESHGDWLPKFDR